MPRHLTEIDGRLALRDHILARASAARDRHGPAIDGPTILRMLDDREFVRYPLGVRFDAAALQPREFAHAIPLGNYPSQGFCLFIHPAFEQRPDLWPLIIAYHIAPVNYGEIADAEDCELLGATLLGLDVETYYARLCEIADSLGPAT